MASAAPAPVVIPLVIPSEACLADRDYTAIDNFAAGNSRESLWTALWGTPGVISKTGAILTKAQLEKIEKRYAEEQKLSEDAITLLNDTKALMEKEAAAKRVALEAGATTLTVEARDALRQEIVDLDLRIFTAAQKKMALLMDLADVRNSDQAVRTKADAEGLVPAMAQALWRKARDTGIITSEDDHVGRARLFCAWVAKSLVYDSKKAAILGDDRSSFDVMVSGRDVCQGFSDVFVAMFNATSPAGTNEESRAAICKGYARTRIDADCAGYVGADHDHTWAVFPLVIPAPAVKPRSAFKVVDPTWFQGEGGTWFTRSNLAFTRDHMPGMRGSYCLADEERGQVRNSGSAAPPFATQDFFVRTLVGLQPAAVDALRLDAASFRPEAQKLDPSKLAGAAVAVSFAKSCPHHLPSDDPVTFYLGLQTLVNGDEWRVDRSSLVPLAVTAGTEAARTVDRFAASFNLSKANNGQRLAVLFPVLADKIVSYPTPKDVPVEGVTWSPVAWWTVSKPSLGDDLVSVFTSFKRRVAKT